MTTREQATNYQHLQTRAEDDVILEIRNASVRFDMDRGSARVLDDVNMDIYRDELLGIVGESGSGKSMFASAILDAVVEPGILQGQIIYHRKEGEPIDILQLEPDELRRLRWDEISMVFQGAMSSFNPTMTVRGHFEETIRAHGADMGERMSHVRHLLSELYLEPERVLDVYPHELSGGMKQRALIALSLVLDPEVLIMDEPTAALDLLMQRSILSLLYDLQQTYDLTIVFITHDLPLVAGIADRLSVMYSFQFVEVGESEEIIRNAAHPYTRALLKSVPSIDTPLDEMSHIEGESPDPVNIPAGCSYHPRCPIATSICVEQDPEFFEVDEDHWAACFHWEEAADAVEYSISSGELTAEDVTVEPDEEDDSG